MKSLSFDATSRSLPTPGFLASCSYVYAVDAPPLTPNAADKADTNVAQINKYQSTFRQWGFD